MMIRMTIMQAGAVPQITLAHRLRIAREFAGLEQAELAQRADMSRTSVVNYELGYRVPRRLYLRSIAEATGVDLQWLETGEASSNDVDEATVRPKGLEPPTFWLGAYEGTTNSGFWTADRKSDLLTLECQLILDVESSLSRWVA